MMQVQTSMKLFIWTIFEKVYIAQSELRLKYVLYWITKNQNLIRSINFSIKT
jgi:hypothetical protein